MKKPILFTAILIFSFYALFAQRSSIELLFTGDDNGEHVTMDSIYIKNLTQGGDTMLYAPDTSFTLLIVGLDNVFANQSNTFSLSQNFPNPFKDQTEFDLFMDENGSLDIRVFNLLGKQVTQFQRSLNKGIHHFSFHPGGDKVYILSATANGITKSIKLFSTSDEKRICSVNHLGNNSEEDYSKSASFRDGFLFEMGDDLLFVGYNEIGESGMVNSPEESTTYTFQYATNIPCIGTPTVDYEGQTYNTIQIFGQCWLKENLNVGTMIDAPQAQLDNDITEKYCMGNNPVECDNYGGIYMWEELMQYTTEEGTQGICPPGWHVPSDAEWKALEGAVDSHYGIGSYIWELTNERGYDAGKNLKSTSGWYNNGNGIDVFGFTAISGGYYYSGVGWAGGALFGPFYTSSHFDSGGETKPYDRGLSWVWNKISRNYDIKEHAKPVRCLKDLN